MTEPTDTKPEDTETQALDNDAPEPANEERKGGSRRPWVAILVLLLLLVIGAAGGAGYFTWKHVLGQFDELRSADATLRAEDSTLRAEAESIKQSIAGLDAHPAIGKLAKFITDEKQVLSVELGKQQQRLQGLQEALEVTHDIATRDQRGWALAEVRYLMNLAHHRLRLLRDLDGTALALEAADQRLYAIGDPLLAPVREELAREIHELRHFKRPDRTGIALKLHNLVTSLEPLPLRGQPPVGMTAEAQPAVQTDAAPEKGWKSLLTTVSQELHRHVAVTRNGEPVEPVLDAETRLYSHQILRLRLEAARLAVLSEDEDEYHRQLQAATAWTQEHFDESAATALLDDLTKLDETMIRPELPTINGSLKKLNELGVTLATKEGK